MSAAHGATRASPCVLADSEHDLAGDHRGVVSVGSLNDPLRPTREIADHLDVSSCDPLGFQNAEVAPPQRPTGPIGERTAPNHQIMHHDAPGARAYPRAIPSLCGVDKTRGRNP